MANTPEQRMQYAEASSPNDRMAGAGAAAGEHAFLGESQREAMNAIWRTLAERRVFAALTGAPGLGKTTVLAMAIAAQQGAAQAGPPRHIIKVDRADQVSAEQAAGIERLIVRQSAFAGRQHTIIIDDAHNAPSGLLRCLTRVAGHCRLNPGSAQVILVGRPELWDRLRLREFDPLVECIAVRPVLEPMTDNDVRSLIKHLLEQPRRIFGQALTADAERAVLRLAEGRPERIGAIIQSTLTLADVQARPPISVEMISDVAAVLDGLRPGQSGRRRTRMSRPGLAAAAVAAIVVGVVLPAPDWPLNRLWPAALDRAHDPLRWAFTWPKPSVGDTAPKLADAARQSPADPPPADDAAAAVADATPMEAVQTAPAAPAPAVLDAPTVAVLDDSATSLATEAQPANQAPDQPSSPALVPSERQEQPPAAPAASAELAGQPVGDDRAQQAVEPSGPAAAAVPEPPPDTGVAAPGAAATPTSAPGAVPVRPAPALVTALLRRGDEELALGDISTARRFYERTIAAGSAQGARGIARTYDPAVLGRGHPAASPATAEAWYNMAAALGGAEEVVHQSRHKSER